MSESDILEYVRADTIVQDAGTDEAVYAEVRRGPWDVQWQRGRDPDPDSVLTARPETIKIRGPFVGTSDQRVIQEDDANWEKALETVAGAGGWDYIEK